MQTIERNELKQWLDQKKDFVLVEALGEDNFNEGHLPGAINIPNEAEHFQQQVQNTLQNKAQPIVVYCANKECPASSNEGQKLESMGYTQVYDYEGGKEDWQQAGYPIVS